MHNHVRHRLLQILICLFLSCALPCYTPTPFPATTTTTSNTPITTTATATATATINQPYGISNNHGQSRRVLNHILKRVNHSAYLTYPMHQDQPTASTAASASPTTTIQYDTIGRYFCGTMGTPLNDCWYSNRFYINGKLFTIANPKEHMSVLQPKGGCGTSSTVSATAKHFSNQSFQGKKPGCRVAVNAGFFTRDVPIVVNTTTNETVQIRCGTRPDAPCQCLGNLVSRKKLVKSTSLQNANFGMRNNAFVVGYLTENEVTSTENPFDELITGVVWLVRNGTNYVDVAATLENPTTQQTSEVLENPNNHRANTFVDVFAARTIIGHDIEGKLKVFQLDGLHGRDRPTRGIDLRSLANILIELGFVNAINLDGGGSSTTVLNDQMVSYPSDICAGSVPSDTLRCERPVSSVICIHDAIGPTVVAPSASGSGSASGSASGSGPASSSSTTPSSSLPSSLPASAPSPLPPRPTPVQVSPSASPVAVAVVSTANTMMALVLAFSLGLHVVACTCGWPHLVKVRRQLVGLMNRPVYKKLAPEVEKQQLTTHSGGSSSIKEVEMEVLDVG